MCYFYGWKLQDIYDLTIDQFESFWQAITPIEAQDMLTQFTILDWPNMKKEARQSLHRKIHKQAFPKTHDPKQDTTKDIFDKLMMVANG